MVAIASHHNLIVGSRAYDHDSRFGSPLRLSRVHWVRPEVVVEVTYLTWTEDNLLRQVSYLGHRRDKPAREVVRPVPHTPRQPSRRRSLPRLSGYDRVRHWGVWP